MGFPFQEMFVSNYNYTMLRVILCLFFTTALFGMNPTSPGLITKPIFMSGDISGFGGYTRNWVFNRYLTAVNGVANGNFSNYSSYQNLGLIGLNYKQRFDLYSLLGTADIRSTLNGRTLNADARFLWGLGGTVLVYQWLDFGIGIDGKFQRYKNHFNGGGKIRNDEWQLSAGISYAFWWLVPYISATYSNVSAYFKRLPVGLFPNITHFDAKNRHFFGLTCGTSLTNGSWGFLNAEVRLIDEWSCAVSGRLAF